MAETRSALDVDDLLANAGWMRLVAARVLHDDSEVDDLVHDAWIAAQRRADQDVQDWPAWLAGVMRNLSRRRLRSSSRLEALPQERELALEDSAPDPAEAFQLELVRRRVARAVLDLPEPFRTTVLLSYFEGLPPQQIARRLGVPCATVRTRLHRALMRLRTRLAAEGGTDARAGLVLLALPRPEPAAPAAPASRWPAAAGSAAAAAMLGLFTWAVWTAGGLSGGGSVQAAGQADGARAVAASPAPEEPDARPEALAPAVTGEENTGSVHDDLSRCGGGPLLGADEAWGEELGVGDLPQPALREEDTPGRRVAAEGVAQRAALPELAHAPLLAAAALGRPAPVAAAPSPAPGVVAGPRFDVTTRGRWLATPTPAPAAGEAEDEDEDAHGDGDGGTRHGMLSGDSQQLFVQSGKVGGPASQPREKAPASDEDLERLCLCRGEDPDAPRARVTRLPAPESAERAPRCPLHPAGPEGPAAVPLLDDGRVAVLIELGQPGVDPLPLAPRAVVLVERAPQPAPPQAR